MGITAVTVGLTIMIIWLSFSKHIKRPPVWLRFIVYRIMANAVCYRLCSEKPRFQFGINKYRKQSPAGGKSETEASEEAVKTEDPLHDHRQRLGPSIVNIKDKFHKIEKEAKAVVENAWQFGVGENVTEEELDQIKEEWIEVTSIINRFSFWVLFTFTITFIIMCVALWV